MDLQGFKYFLKEKQYDFDNKKYTEKSISSRISRAKKTEKILKEEFSLDDVVASKQNMMCAIEKLKHHDTKNQNLQNALLRYYEFKNRKQFEF